MRKIRPVIALLIAASALGLAGCKQSSGDGLSGASMPGGPAVEAPPAQATEALPTAAVEPPASTDGGPLVPPGVVADADPKADKRGSDGTFSSGSDSTDATTAIDSDAYLAAHNRWRANYGTSPVAWDGAVAAYAQEWADQLAARNAFEHRSNGTYGENIWTGTAGRFTSDQVVDSWGSEVQFWDVSCSGGINVCCRGGWQNCGHFTQVVWYATLKVGCGKATSARGMDIVVCNYDPPGNFPNQNPFPPQTGGSTAPTAAPTAAATAVPTRAATSRARVQPTATRTPASAGPGQTTMTWWKSWDNLGLDIPDAGDPVSQVLEVNQSGVIRGIGVSIKITHSYVGDLSVMLVHPNGTQVMLRNQTGGSAQGINAVYGTGGIPVAGLTALNGQPMAGDWQLVVQDLAEEDTGTLDSVKLEIKYSSN